MWATQYRLKLGNNKIRGLTNYLLSRSAEGLLSLRNTIGGGRGPGHLTSRVDTVGGMRTFSDCVCVCGSEMVVCCHGGTTVSGQY